MAKVGILVIATGKYISFVPALVESIKTNFLKDHDRCIYLFTDKYQEVHEKIRPFLEKGFSIIPIQETHMPWPYPTLMRYSCFCKAAEVINKEDYLFYLDADMKVVGEVGDEIFPDKEDCLYTAVMHPGNLKRNMWSDYEHRPISKAFVAEGTKSFTSALYCAGGFQGGIAGHYLAACGIMAMGIAEDAKKGIVAKWHDESHWNRFILSFPDKVLKMTSNYCLPETGYEDLMDKAKIIALDKNHEEMRKEK